jgi:hypothetical protein
LLGGGYDLLGLRSERQAATGLVGQPAPMGGG